MQMRQMKYILIYLLLASILPAYLANFWTLFAVIILVFSAERFNHKLIVFFGSLLGVFCVGVIGSKDIFLHLYYLPTDGVTDVFQLNKVLENSFSFDYKVDEKCKRMVFLIDGNVNIYGVRNQLEKVGIRLSFHVELITSSLIFGGYNLDDISLSCTSQPSQSPLSQTTASPHMIVPGRGSD